MKRQAILPLDGWPAADRALWAALTRCAGPLDEPGALARHRPASLTTLRDGYGRWLGWLGAQAPDLLAEAPPARATLPRLLAWLEALGEHAPTSRQMFLRATLRVVMAAAPEADWRAHRRLERALGLEAEAGRGGRKTGRILSSALLFETGMEHVETPPAEEKTDLQRALRRRDGLMVAMLALMPMRLRAFAGLRIGSSIRFEPERVLVLLEPGMTKTGAVWDAPVPGPLVAPLRRYLAEDRPELMAHGREPHDVLWVTGRGTGYHPNALSFRIKQVTEALTGVSVPPHFFRDAAATTLARTSPDAARLTRGLLGHSGFRTAERHYNQARALEAGRDYAAVLERLRGEEP